MGLLYTLKISLLVLILLSFSACSSLPKDRSWNTAKELRGNLGILQTGDIIVKNKKLDPLSWYGHAAIMVTDLDIGDYPKIGVGYYEIDSYSWLYEKRNVIVLRYKNFDERFKKQLLKNIKENNDKGYFIDFDKRNNNTFYCSKFVWYLYWKTAKDLGYPLDIDSDGGPLVMPYDLLGSKDLVQVDF